MLKSGTGIYIVIKFNCYKFDSFELLDKSRLA